MQFLTHRKTKTNLCCPELWERWQNTLTPAFNCKCVKSRDMTWANIWDHQKASWIRPRVDSRAWDNGRTCRNTYSTEDRCTTVRQWPACFWPFTCNFKHYMQQNLQCEVDKQSPAITLSHWNTCSHSAHHCSSSCTSYCDQAICNKTDNNRFLFIMNFFFGKRISVCTVQWIKSIESDNKQFKIRSNQYISVKSIRGRLWKKETFWDLF